MTPLIAVLTTLSIAWPSVVPMRTSIRVDDSPKAAIDLPLKLKGGQQGYLLKCRSGDYEDPEFNWSGNLQCRLLPVPPEDLDNLLADCAGYAKEWDNRGRFLKDEVVGPCAAYPEFGARRSFSLRGMRLTLELSDIHPPAAHKHGLGAYTLHVQVEADPTADSRCAARPTVPNPLVPHPSVPGRWRRTCEAEPAVK